jgi:hypothetical protein
MDECKQALGSGNLPSDQWMNAKKALGSGIDPSDRWMSAKKALGFWGI